MALCALRAYALPGSMPRSLQLFAPRFFVSFLAILTCCHLFALPSRSFRGLLLWRVPHRDNLLRLDHDDLARSTFSIYRLVTIHSSRPLPLYTLLISLATTLSFYTGGGSRSYFAHVVCLGLLCRARTGCAVAPDNSRLNLPCLTYAGTAHAYVFAHIRR